MEVGPAVQVATRGRKLRKVWKSLEKENSVPGAVQTSGPGKGRSPSGTNVRAVLQGQTLNGKES